MTINTQPSVAPQQTPLPSHVTGVLQIDIQSIINNYLTLKAMVGRTACIPVVKANAYGFGLRQVAQALLGQGCNAFFVAHLEEGLELRQASPDAHIYILSGVLAGTESLFVDQRLTPVLNSFEMLNRWANHTHSINQKLDCVLHFDTGMHRLGFDSNDLSKLLESPQLLNDLNIQFIMSHLASSGDSSEPLNGKQNQAFELLRTHFPHTKASLADTGGIYLGKDYHYDVVRPGKGLFGLFNKPDLAPCVSLYGQVLQVHKAKERETVGYDGAHALTRDSRLATIGIGFADGYDRRLSNHGHVQIGEFKAPVVGRISMDYTVIDITDIPEALCYTGSWVEFIGPSNKLDLLAQCIGTISRELSTGFSSRLHRVYC